MYEVWIDATSRPALMPGADKKKLGSVGPAAIAVIIKKDKQIVRSFSQYIGVCDNNAAEYKAFVEAMFVLLELEVSEAIVNTDSSLLEKQMNNIYACRAASLVDLYREAKRLSQFIPSIKIRWIPRKENKEADALASSVFDEWDPSLLRE